MLRPDMFQEDLLRSLADASPVMLRVFGPDARCTFLNQAWLTFRGRALEQEQDEGWLEGVHVDDRDHCLDTCRQSIQARKPFEVEYRLRRSDGAFRFVLDKLAPWITDDAGFLGHVCITTDVTQNREDNARAARSELERRLGEQRYHSIINATSILVWTADAAGKLLTSTPPWHEYTGRAAEEVSGSAWVNALAADERERVLMRIRESLSTLRPYVDEWRVRRADGKVRHLSVRGVPLRDDEGRVHEWTGVCMDVTDRTWSEVLLSAVADNALDGIIGIDEHGIILSFN